MEGERNPQKLERYMQIVHSELERIVTLVHRMREIIALQPGKQYSDPHEVLQDVLALSAKQLLTGSCCHRNRAAAKSSSIKVHPDHIKQVFGNLILNAADAMPGGGTLRITTGLEPFPGPTAPPALCVRFADTGAGMSPEVVRRLFEPFFTTKEHGSGSGVICQLRDH